MPDSAADFAAFRAALVAATRAASGLGQNSVVMQQPNEPNAPRPTRPFAALRIQSPSIVHGRLSCEHAGNYGDQVGQFIYSGQRSMVCVWDFYGDTPEDAFALGSTVQIALNCEPVYGILKAAGLSIWRVNDLVDLTTLLNTGYEGRAHLTVTLGYVARVTLDVGVIEDVPVSGSVLNGNATVATVDITADI